MASSSENSKSWDWETFQLERAPIQGRIFSAIKLLLQNTSNPFFNRSLLDYSMNFDPFFTNSSAQMRNLTSVISSPPVESLMDEPSNSAETFETVPLAKIYLEYFVTLLVVLIVSWILNRLVWKSDMLETVSETFISYLVFLPISPFLIVFFTILLSIRGCVMGYLWVFRRSSGLSLLSALDSFWAYETYASCSASVGLYIIEGNCDPEAIKKRIQQTVQHELVGGKMEKRLVSVLGFPAWESETKFDINDHIKVVLDEGESSVGEGEVFSFMAGFQDKIIRNKAPWEVYIIPKFAYDKPRASPEADADGNETGPEVVEKASSQNSSGKPLYAAIFRIHHGIMDGISTANILHSLMADKPFRFSVDPLEPLHKGKRPSKLQTFVLYSLGLLSVPRVAIRNIFLMDHFYNKGCLPGPKLTGPKTFLWSRPISMNALKQIKNSTKTSVFSVILTAIGGAHRKNYLQRGKLPEADFLHVMSPIALLPYPDRKPRNGFTGIIVPMSVGKELETMQRLKVNHDNCRKLASTSASIMAIGNYYFPMMLGVMPLILQKLFSSFVYVKMTLSNVPGPCEDVRIFGGGRLIDIGIWVPIKMRIGLGMGLFSYGDRVRATLIGDKVSCPNKYEPQFIMEAFESELRNLAQGVGLLDESDLFIAT